MKRSPLLQSGREGVYTRRGTINDAAGFSPWRFFFSFFLCLPLRSTSISNSRDVSKINFISGGVIE